MMGLMGKITSKAEITAARILGINASLGMPVGSKLDHVRLPSE